jgi:hypothetical protein
MNAELLCAYNLTSCPQGIKRKPPAKQACPQNGQCIFGEAAGIAANSLWTCHPHKFMG